MILLSAYKTAIRWAQENELSASSDVGLSCMEEPRTITEKMSLVSQHMEEISSVSLNNIMYVSSELTSCTERNQIKQFSLYVWGQYNNNY